MKSTVKHTEIALNGISKSKFTAFPEVVEAVNFKVCNGHLKDGLNISAAEFGDKGERAVMPNAFEVSGMFCGVTSNGERLLVSGTELNTGRHAVYSCDTKNPSGGFVRLDCEDVEKPIFTTAKMYGGTGIIFTSGDGRLFYYDGLTISQGECPSGTVSLCFFKNRTVAVTDGCVYLSHGDALTFVYAESEVLYLPESFHARSAAVFGDEVVIAGNRGVARLVTVSFGTAFEIRTVCADAELFYPETLSVSGEGAYLLSENGLAVFNGVTFTYSNKETVEGVVRGVSGFFADGEYHASVEVVDFPQKHLILSYGRDGFYVSDVCALATSRANDGRQTLLLLKGKADICSIAGGYASPAPIRRIKTSTCDFGTAERKVLTELSLRSESTVSVRIRADGRAYNFVVRGGEGRRSICPYVTAREFSFEVIFEGIGANISGIQLKAECCA